MRFYFFYNTVYATTFLFSILQAIICYMTMIGSFYVKENFWVVLLFFESFFLVMCAFNYDNRFPYYSPNHNVYRTYILSLLAIVLTVFIFMILAIYKLVIPEVAIMTYLYFCLPIWLNLLVTFFVLQDKYK